MGAGHEHVGDDVLVLGRHASAALAAPVLRTEGRERSTLDVAIHGHCHDHFIALDQVFIVDSVGSGGNLGHARRGISLADQDQFVLHHAIELHPVRQDREIFLDRQGQFLKLVTDLVPAQRSQAMQPQVKDCLHLNFGQAIGAAFLFGARLNRLDQLDVGGDIANRPFARQQCFARRCRIGRPTNDPHHFIKIGNGNHQTKQDVGPVTCFVQFELGAAGDHFLAEGNEAADDIAQRQHFGPAAADCQHVCRERALCRGVAPKLVQNNLGGGIALQIDHHAHAQTARFVTDVRDAFDPLVLGGFGNLFDQTVLADLVGNRGQHDRATITAAFFNLMPRAHDHRTTPGQIGGARAGRAKDQRGSGEVRPRNNLDQLFRGNRRVFDIG